MICVTAMSKEVTEFWKRNSNFIWRKVKRLC